MRIGTSVLVIFWILSVSLYAQQCSQTTKNLNLYPVFNENLQFPIEDYFQGPNLKYTSESQSDLHIQQPMTYGTSVSSGFGLIQSVKSMVLGNGDLFLAQLQIPNFQTDLFLILGKKQLKSEKIVFTNAVPITRNKQYPVFKTIVSCHNIIISNEDNILVNCLNQEQTNLYDQWLLYTISTDVLQSVFKRQISEAESPAVTQSVLEEYQNPYSKARLIYYFRYVPSSFQSSPFLEFFTIDPDSSITLGRKNTQDLGIPSIVLTSITTILDRIIILDSFNHYILTFVFDGSDANQLTYLDYRWNGLKVTGKFFNGNYHIVLLNKNSIFEWTWNNLAGNPVPLSVYELPTSFDPSNAQKLFFSKTHWLIKTSDNFLYVFRREKGLFVGWIDSVQNLQVLSNLNVLIYNSNTIQQVKIAIPKIIQNNINPTYVDNGFVLTAKNSQSSCQIQVSLTYVDPKDGNFWAPLSTGQPVAYNQFGDFDLKVPLDTYLIGQNLTLSITQQGTTNQFSVNQVLQTQLNVSTQGIIYSKIIRLLSDSDYVLWIAQNGGLLQISQCFSPDDDNYIFEFKLDCQSKLNLTLNYGSNVIDQFTAQITQSRMMTFVFMQQIQDYNFTTFTLFNNFTIAKDQKEITLNDQEITDLQFYGGFLWLCQPNAHNVSVLNSNFQTIVSLDLQTVTATSKSTKFSPKKLLVHPSYSEFIFVQDSSYLYQYSLNDLKFQFIQKIAYKSSGNQFRVVNLLFTKTRLVQIVDDLISFFDIEDSYNFQYLKSVIFVGYLIENTKFVGSFYSDIMHVLAVQSVQTNLISIRCDRPQIETYYQITQIKESDGNNPDVLSVATFGNIDFVYINSQFFYIWHRPELWVSKVNQNSSYTAIDTISIQNFAEKFVITLQNSQKYVQILPQTQDLLNLPQNQTSMNYFNDSLYFQGSTLDLKSNCAQCGSTFKFQSKFIEKSKSFFNLVDVLDLYETEQSIFVLTKASLYMFDSELNLQYNAIYLSQPKANVCKYVRPLYSQTNVLRFTVSFCQSPKGYYLTLVSFLSSDPFPMYALSFDYTETDLSGISGLEVVGPNIILYQKKEGAPSTLLIYQIDFQTAIIKRNHQILDVVDYDIWPSALQDYFYMITLNSKNQVLVNMRFKSNFNSATAQFPNLLAYIKSQTNLYISPTTQLKGIKMIDSKFFPQPNARYTNHYTFLLATDESATYQFSLYLGELDQYFDIYQNYTITAIYSNYGDQLKLKSQSLRVSTLLDRFSAIYENPLAQTYVQVDYKLRNGQATETPQAQLLNLNTFESGIQQFYQGAADYRPLMYFQDQSCNLSLNQTCTSQLNLNTNGGLSIYNFYNNYILNVTNSTYQNETIYFLPQSYYTLKSVFGLQAYQYTPPEPTPPGPPIPPTNSSSKWWISLIVIFGVAILGGVGWLIYKKKKSNKTTEMEDGVKSLRINSNDEVPYVVVNDSAEK